jgi:geranylgeranyl diphosphate synthase type II
MTVDALTSLIERELKTLEWKRHPANLYEPIEYILSLGGKRMRPLLVLLGYSLFKNDPERILKPALAVEVFHNFTLMHDDIMDKAPIRRGEPTVHEKWNETIAILSGDTMMVKAYELLVHVDPKYLPRALELFNTCAIEVCEGQQMDMNFESQDEVHIDEYLEMIRLKTAVLLGFSLELGGLLAGANEEEQRRLNNFGIHIGMSFQLMDDHLDTFGGESFGKQIGGDIRSNKKTFLLISALEQSSPDNKTRLLKWLSTEGQDDEKVQGVTEIFRKEEIDIRSKDKIQRYADQALKVLNELPGEESVKKILMGYIHQLNQRVV